MRRTARRLFALCSAVSLVLCVAVCVLWVRSLTTMSFLSCSSREGPRAVRHVVNTFGGRLTYWRKTYYYDPTEIRSGEIKTEPFELEERTLPRSTARFLYDTEASVVEVKTLALGSEFYLDGGFEISSAFWLLAAATALPPLLRLGIWVRRWRTGRHARRVGLCPSCAYDLRATPGRCPECGAAASSPP